MKALLNEEGKKIWGYVCPDGNIPVKSVAPFKARLDRIGEMDVYLVDWAALTETQRDLILDHLKTRFRNSKKTVETAILKEGLPIRACLVSCVSIPARFF
jgi:hypothetical protein